MCAKRNFDDPKYIAWRNAVFARDGYVCQLTGKKGGRLEAHHIRRVADRPDLTHAISNGITLSQEAHELVTGREDQFIEQFEKIIEEKMKNQRNKRKAKKDGVIGMITGWRPKNPRIRV